jgi:uncharacterized membrane protein YkvA (DUF1232 family)
MITGAVVISVILRLNVPIGMHQTFVTKSTQVNVTSGNSTTLISVNSSRYQFEYNFLISKEVFDIWDFVYFFFRDLFILIGILIVNILILRVISQMVKTRRELFRSDGGEENATVKATLKAEKRKMIMMLLTGVNFIPGRLVNILAKLFYYVVPLDYSTLFLGCLWFLDDLLLTLSYATPFFFYYFFNERFKKETNNLLLYSFVKKAVKSVATRTTTTHG